MCQLVDISTEVKDLRLSIYSRAAKLKQLNKELYNLHSIYQQYRKEYKYALNKLLDLEEAEFARGYAQEFISYTRATSELARQARMQQARMQMISIRRDLTDTIEEFNDIVTTYDNFLAVNVLVLL